MDIVDKIYSTLHDNEYVSTILTTLLVVYGSTAAPKLPKIIRMLFSNIIFKVIFLGLIAYSVNRDPKLSILLAVVFTITLSLLDQQTFFEGFTDKLDDDHDHDHNNDLKKKNNCKDVEFDEKEIRDGKNWKQVCCCDFKNPPPQYTGACLDRIGDDVDNEDFDYENHVCAPPTKDLDEELDEELGGELDQELDEMNMELEDYYVDEDK